VDEPTTVDSKAKLAANYGRQVRLVGKYGVQSLGGHAIIERQSDGSVSRRRQAAFLVLSDDVTVSLAGRSDSEMRALDGHNVVAIGTLQEPVSRGDRSVARPNPMPALVNIESIQPA
jgi:hypothetical protein